MMNDEKVQVCVNTGKEPFFYKGYVIDDTKPDVIIFKDDRVGEVKISKHAIVAIQKVQR